MTPISLHGKALNIPGHALICVPLIGRTREEILGELAFILPKLPDVIEWRVDFFAHIQDLEQVLALANEIRRTAGKTPIIFTRRAAHEGGEKISLNEAPVVAMYEAVCASGAVDFIDYELSQAPADRARLRDISRQYGVSLILSHHNFASTPAADKLIDILSSAASEGADIAKVAVMPQSAEDTQTLLAATLEASHRLSIPIITMAMGELGVCSRIHGAAYGSALTFAVGSGRSAPGQLAIDELRKAMAESPTQTQA